MKNQPKTLDEHRDYLFDIVRLKLFFLFRWQKEHPEEAFADILRNRVDIFRKTELNPEGLNPQCTYFDLPGWLELENRLKEIYDRAGDDEKFFEEQGFEAVRPQLEKRCERDFYDRSRLAGYQCGFLRHNLQLNSDGETLGFHIANDRQPDSFMTDRKYIRECFTRLLDAAENEFRAVNIGTFSWLNSVDKWLALFPQEWQDNLEEADTMVRWNYGFWGQFINARGCFNAGAAGYLRRTGRLLYYPRRSHCTIAAMRRHLEEM